MHPKETLISQGASDSDCYLIVKGKLEVRYRPAGCSTKTTLEEKSEVEISSASPNKTGWGAARQACRPPSSKADLTAFIGLDKDESGAKEQYPRDECEDVDVGDVVATLEDGSIAGEIVPLADDIYKSELDEPASTVGFQSNKGLRAARFRESGLESSRSRTPRTRTATVIAVDHCELFSISGQELEGIVMTFADVRHDLVGTARERVRQLREYDTAAMGGQDAAQTMRPAVATEEVSSRQSRTTNACATAHSVAQQTGGNLRLLHMAINSMKTIPAFEDGMPRRYTLPKQLQQSGSSLADVSLTSIESAVKQAVESSVTTMLKGPLLDMQRELIALRNDVAALKMQRSGNAQDAAPLPSTSAQMGMEDPLAVFRAKSSSRRRRVKKEGATHKVGDAQIGFV